MAEITVALIKTLRDKTNAGMMDCKAALKEANGDLEAAETVLRKKGIASADKKAGRAAKEGVIASHIDDSSKVGVLVEVNCETDFVAKNESFQELVDSILNHLATSDPAADAEALLEQPLASDTDQTVGEMLKAKIGSLGENMAVPRFTHYALDGSGVVASYIHLQGKVGVLIEVGTASDEIAQNEEFREMVKDITLHIAAAQPVCISRDEVPAEKLATEKEIYVDQVKGKPENIIEKIVEGKLDKFLSGICLLEQGFVKDPDQTIAQLVEAKSKALGGDITIKRFVRYALGEGAE